MDHHGLGHTQALYLRLAGSAPTTPELRAQLAGSVDWTSLRALGRRDGVTGELWRRLTAAGARPPAEVASAWAREAQVADFRQLRLEQRLAEVYRLLAAEGDAPVLLKGAALAYAVHGGMRHRPMADLDLLVAPEALEGAVARLEGAGWTALAPRGAYAAHHHAPPLADPAGEGVIVELHRALLPDGHPFHLTAGALRGRAVRMAVPWGWARLPDRTDLLLHACLHFAWSHELRWGGWRALADVAALLGAPDRGWLADVPARVAEARTERAVGWTLRLARELGGTTLPAPLEAMAAGAGGGRALTRHLAHQLLPGPGMAPSVWLARRAWTRALRPPGVGPGAPRPWRQGPAPRGETTAPPGSAVGRALRQLGRPAAWAGYARALFGRSGRG